MARRLVCRSTCVGSVATENVHAAVFESAPSSAVQKDEETKARTMEAHISSAIRVVFFE
jgi:hypothetical protein